MKKKHRMKRTFGEHVFVTANGLFLTLFFIVCLYPIVYVFSASFSDPVAVSTGKMLLFPVEPSLDGYDFVFKYKDIWKGYANTIFYTVFGTIFSLFLTIPAAYALSRKGLYGSGIVMTMFIITMYFGGGLIPVYLNYSNLGLINTRLTLVVNGALSTYNLIVARTFFANSIPEELLEAARMDGCGVFKSLLKIVLPLSAPILVVMSLYYGVAQWNAYFDAMIYLKDRDLYPLQMFLKEILTESKVAAQELDESGLSAQEILELQAVKELADRMKYCVIVVSTVPMLVVYPFIQKFFNKGVMIGSVKG